MIALIACSFGGVFPEPPPDLLHQTPPVVSPHEEGECVADHVIAPGAEVPCAGYLVPRRKIAALLFARDSLPELRTALEDERTARLSDREICEVVSDGHQQEVKALKREVLRGRILVVTVGFATTVVAGGAAYTVGRLSRP